MKEGILVASSNSGRYAVDDPNEGQDLTSGQVLEILLNGEWIPGSIEHAGSLYALEGTRRAESGYYFISENGGVCGLCAGMKIRLLD